MRAGREGEARRPRGSGLGVNSMFRKVLLHGLLFLVVTALAMVLVSVAFSSPLPRRGSLEPSARYFAENQEALLGDPAERARELARVGAATHFEISLYRLDGSLLDTTVEPPLPPLAPSEQHLLAKASAQLPGKRAPALARLQFEGKPYGYLLLRLPPLGPPWDRLLTTFALILVGLGLVSIPIARSITAPIERLMDSVRRLGAGELSARAGLTGSDEVGQLGRAFDEMAERLQRLIRREKQLLADVSHELRTPLARIRVALEMAAEGDAEGSRHYLGEIGIDLAELERLVADVLATARLELATDRSGNGQTPLQRSVIAPAGIVEASVQRFRRAHPERPLILEIEPSLPEIDADPELLRRAIDNLLDNARKYSEAAEPITLRARAGDTSLEVEVEDRGIGIGSDDQARLFTPFFRADQSRARASGGVGLGLALTRRIVEDHGGFVDVVSEPGKGSTFRFKIPSAARRAG